MIDNHYFSSLLFLTGLVVSSVCGRANDFTEQARRIQILEQEGHLPQAISATSTLIDFLKRSDPQSLFLPEAYDRRASLEQDLSQFAEAEHDYLTAVALWEAAPAPPPLSFATELNNLASLYSATGQWKKAEALRRRSLALRLAFSGSESSEVALSLSNLAIDLFRQGRDTESASFCRQALDLWAKAAPERDRSELALNTLALIELREQQPSRGLSSALAALKQYGASLHPTPIQRAAYEHTVALAREANGEWDEALRSFTSARQCLEHTEHPPVREQCALFRDYAHLLLALHRKKEAKQLLRQADAIGRNLGRTEAQRYTVDWNALWSASKGNK